MPIQYKMIPSFRYFFALKSHLKPHPNRKLVALSFKILVDTYNELRTTGSENEMLI